MALTGSDYLTQQSAAGSGGTDFSKAYIANHPETDEPYVKDPAALWKEVQELRDDSLTARKAHERLWALCWMFYKGDQWRKPAPAPDWNIIRVNVGKRPKITINKILPMVATRRAHVLKNRPVGVVMPASINEEDRNAARIGNDILAYDQDHLKNWEILDGKLSLTMFVTGNAFKKIYWDPTKGPVNQEKNAYTIDRSNGVAMPTPDQSIPSGTTVDSTAFAAASEAAKSQEGEMEGQSDEPAEPPMEEAVEPPGHEAAEGEPDGDIVIEFVPPEEILPEPAATDLESCQRMLHRTLKTVKWVRDTFGEAAEKVEPINLRTDRGKALAQGAKLFGLTEREVANRVEVLEAWFRPSAEFPLGLHAVWADDKMMAAGPTPEAHEHIPFVHYQEIDTDEFWGMSSVSQVIDVQKALNLAVSRDEYMRQRLRPKLMAPSDSGIDESQYSNDDSEIVYYHHPFKPTFTDPPAYERDEKATAFFKAAVDDIGGSADIMRGQLSGGEIRSGRMVNYLQEYAGTVLSGPARQIERGEEKTGNMILRLRKHYTPEPRLYYIVGRNKDVEVKTFIGSDIQGCGDYRVQTDSALPSSIAEKRDTVFTAVEKGIFLPGDPRLVKMLGMPSDINEMFDEDQVDRDNATEENQKFLTLTEEMAATAFGLLQQNLDVMTEGKASQMGVMPQPSQVLDGLGLMPRDFENHQVHILTHNKERKTKAYRSLPKAVQALFDEHVDQHLVFLLPPPPPAGPSGPGSPGGKTPDGKPGAPGAQPGNPSALQGPREAPGPGGAGNPEQNRPVPKPPMANAHGLRGG